MSYGLKYNKNKLYAAYSVYIWKSPQGERRAVRPMLDVNYFGFYIDSGY